MGARRYGTSPRAHSSDIELNTRREFHISKQVQLFFYCINISSKQEEVDLIHVSKNRMCCHSFMALNRPSDISAADWLSQTRMKN